MQIPPEGLTIPPDFIGSVKSRLSKTGQNLTESCFLFNVIALISRWTFLILSQSTLTRILTIAGIYCNVNNVSQS